MTHREQLQISLQAWERLLDLLSLKYVKWLEEDSAGCSETLAYLQERIDYCFTQWDYTRRQLSALPPLIDLTASAAKR